MDLLGRRIDVTKPMRGLSIADQQMVEIARALASRQPPHHHGRADRAADAQGSRRRCSTSPGGCATRAAPSSSSRTGSRKCARCATASPSSATATRSRPSRYRDAHRRRHHPPDDRPAAQGIHAQARRNDRRGRPRGRTADAARLFRRHQLRGARGRDRRARRPGRRRPHRRRPRHLRRRPGAERHGHRRRQARHDRRAGATPSPSASPSCPRTAPSPAFSARCRSNRTSPPRCPTASRRAASSAAPSRRRWPRSR